MISITTHRAYKSVLAWLPCLLVLGCSKKDSNADKTTGAGPCRKAQVGWQVASASGGLKKAGISTQPPGHAEKLMSHIPNAVHGWIQECRAQKKWTCGSTAILWFRVDGQGKVTSTKGETACPATKCLLPFVKASKIPEGLVPKNTRVCLYLRPLASN